MADRLNTQPQLQGGSSKIHRRRTKRATRHEIGTTTEEPVGLLREVIESSSRQGELVYDPYAGIGSTGVAERFTRRLLLLNAIRLT